MTFKFYRFTCEEWKQEVLRKHTVRKKFKEDYLWNIQRNCLKWTKSISLDEMADNSSGAFVSSSSSDAHVGIHVNTDEYEAAEEAPRRPAGRY
ncbi:hypothetical protein Hanom_Chr16g01490611 [Helianthus anomalus]